MSKQVLIIDDEASIRQSLGAALKDEGYKIMAGASGREGLDLLKAESFETNQNRVAGSNGHHDVGSRQYRNCCESCEERRF
jgi:CheY-like chemotaxis protein